MFTSSGSTGGSGRGRGGNGDAKTIISPNTSFGDIIKYKASSKQTPRGVGGRVKKAEHMPGS